ncbi:MAG: plasmid partitioning protein RepB [Hyphomicrobiales bacterium]|nr:plasmid partitioning protein RepB [Hyphomicrobiales bacterium]MDE2114288.1 plasmid partitioning protein RepB [Hyphomicrobiales bacterium]
MSRKALFANLGSVDSSTENTATTPKVDVVPDDIRSQSRLRTRPIMGSPELLSGHSASPVGAIGQSLGEISARAARADEIERKLIAGQVIVELDPALVDPSFIADRMPSSDADSAELTEAIRQHGQFNPIMVRPHPESPGRFQVAFGHRRLRAVATLGLQVKAVVRDLSDEQLAIAQGQENHERKDLSYIEKARFAHRLEQRFGRATIMAALSIYKSDLSNMLSVVSKIPEEIITAIGPAPTIGRRNWLELADIISKRSASASVLSLALDSTIAALPSDERFRRIISSMKTQSTAAHSETWRSNNGEPLAVYSENSKRVTLTIDRQKSPQFADFVMNRLQTLYLEFQVDSLNRL